MKKSKPLAKFTALIVVIILSSCHVFSQSIATSQGEFRLIPVEDLVDATAAKSAKRTAELAIPALISDSKKVAQTREALQPEIDSYKNDLKKYDTDLMLYNISLKSYNENLNTYEAESTRYDADLQPYNMSVEAYNNNENKTEAEYNQLLASKNRLDIWLQSLDSKKSELDLALSRLNNFKSDIDLEYAQINAKYETLNYKLNEINIEMGRIYGQLLVLNSYSKDCNVKLEQWSEPILNTYNLNTELEKLKELSSRGWN